MEDLPSDTLKLLSSFLTGHDAFELSHTSSWWFKYIADGSFWQRRLRSTNSWTKRLMVAPSLLFQGQRAGNNLQLDSFAYLVDMTSLVSQSFSFDVWFSLLPASDEKSFGGVIYGLQSAKRDSRPWPHYHQPIVDVNARGDLYCSVLDAKPVVASDLKSSRWYHVVLTYDHDSQRQDVLLDGESVRSDAGALHQERRHLTHEQVGTGCVTGGDLEFAYRGHLGWYGFHGIMDDFRVWEGALTLEDVAELAYGGRLPSKRLRGSVKSLVASPMCRGDRRVNVQLTSCTRPTEDAEVELM